MDQTDQRAEGCSEQWLPDITEALLDCPHKKVKLGRPPKSTNINLSMHTTYQSYAASKEKNC
jgi:hypothetical protein